MPGIKEIKNRIKSISDTQKITNAMYLVASARLSAARNTVFSQREYSDEAQRMLACALAHSGGESVYTRDNGKARDAVLVLGGDRGLCGDYNKNVARFVSSVIGGLENPAVYVSGGRVKSLLIAAGITPDESFEPAVKKPDNETAAMISDYFEKLFTDGVISSFSVIYADFSDRSKLRIKKILPVSAVKDDASRCEFLPGAEEVLDTLIPLYLKSEIRSCILSSFCSEQNSRMMAMKNANDNAGDLLSELRLEYNHTRQNAITGEITEISGERNLS
ncbi:MAG: ATP synthase F1 subunit gamma [Clostridia bacterium]|nr:ATP synthase F1 subunit gamma [Clostridia bacterium]